MKKKSSLRFKITLILLVFMVSMLGLIYIFQTSMLDVFYKANKISYIESTANAIAESIQNDNEDLSTAIEKYTFSNEVCVRVETTIGGLYTEGNSCALGKLRSSDVAKISEATINAGGSKLFSNLILNYNNTFSQDIYLYTKIIDLDGESVMVMVSTNIVPIVATIQTISNQYTAIFFTVIICTLVLALVLSTIIVKPFNRIEVESRNLPQGKYDKDTVKPNSLETETLNDTLANANEQIIKADKARKELIGNVSHDLRTPLTMIVGYGEMIRDLPEENNEDNINVIIDEAKRLSTLVDDLLDLSKVESGKIELHKENVSINSMLNSVYKQYEQYCKAKDVDFKLELIDDYTAYIDENRIKQVLYNFINNSLNYNTKDNKEIILGCELVNNKHRIYVYDNGNGIKDSDIDKIWDRYYKVDKEHKRAHLGSGIGLSLSRDLLIASDLNYGVESKEGEYSKFYFEV